MLVYINGILATTQDLAELEHNLRLGYERAFAKCCNGFIYYKTI